MNSEVRDALAAHRKYVILRYAREFGNVKNVCKEFEVARASFYRWKKAYDAEGKAGLLRKKPVARSHPRQIPAASRSTREQKCFDPTTSRSRNSAHPYRIES